MRLIVRSTRKKSQPRPRSRKQRSLSTRSRTGEWAYGSVSPRSVVALASSTRFHHYSWSSSAVLLFGCHMLFASASNKTNAREYVDHWRQTTWRYYLPRSNSSASSRRWRDLHLFSKPHPFLLAPPQTSWLLAMAVLMFFLLYSKPLTLPSTYIVTVLRLYTCCMNSKPHLTGDSGLTRAPVTCSIPVFFSFFFTEMCQVGRGIWTSDY